MENDIDDKIVDLYAECDDLGLDLTHPTKCVVTDWLNDQRLRAKVAELLK